MNTNIWIWHTVFSHFEIALWLHTAGHWCCSYCKHLSTVSTFPDKGDSCWVRYQVWLLKSNMWINAFRRIFISLIYEHSRATSATSKANYWRLTHVKWDVPCWVYGGCVGEPGGVAIVEGMSVNLVQEMGTALWEVTADLAWSVASEQVVGFLPIVGAAISMCTMGHAYKSMAKGAIKIACTKHAAWLTNHADVYGLCVWAWSFNLRRGVWPSFKSCPVVRQFWKHWTALYWLRSLVAFMILVVKYEVRRCCVFKLSGWIFLGWQTCRMNCCFL